MDYVSTHWTTAVPRTRHGCRRRLSGTTGRVSTRTLWLVIGSVDHLAMPACKGNHSSARWVEPNTPFIA